jgi:hypothetical protein
MLGQHNFVLSLTTHRLAAALGTLAGCARAATSDVTLTPLTAPPPTLEVFDFRTLLTSSRGGGLEPQVTQSHHPASFGIQNHGSGIHFKTEHCRYGLDPIPLLPVSERRWWPIRVNNCRLSGHSNLREEI